jgi:RHH-type rel operon transcriptional repressor/antitoxin RelB
MKSIALGAVGPEDIKNALAELSELTGQAIESISEDALREYLAWRKVQEADLRVALEQADRGEFAADEEVASVFARYGSKPSA